MPTAFLKIAAVDRSVSPFLSVTVFCVLVPVASVARFNLDPLVHLDFALEPICVFDTCAEFVVVDVLAVGRQAFACDETEVVLVVGLVYRDPFHLRLGLPEHSVVRHYLLFILPQADEGEGDEEQAENESEDRVVVGMVVAVGAFFSFDLRQLIVSESNRLFG